MPGSRLRGGRWPPLAFKGLVPATPGRNAEPCRELLKFGAGRADRALERGSRKIRRLRGRLSKESGFTLKVPTFRREATEGGEGFKVTATAATAGHTFTVNRTKSGEAKRECTPTGRTGSEGGGCQNSSS